MITMMVTNTSVSIFAYLGHMQKLYKNKFSCTEFVLLGWIVHVPDTVVVMQQNGRLINRIDLSEIHK